MMQRKNEPALGAQFVASTQVTGSDDHKTHSISTGINSDPQAPTGEIHGTEPHSPAGGMDTEAPPRHYYLHIPDTPASLRVVAPVNGSTTIRNILHDRVVLEFPTIYVLTDGADGLAEPFITEQAWSRQRSGIEEVEEWKRGDAATLDGEQELQLTAEVGDEDILLSLSRDAAVPNDSL